MNIPQNYGHSGASIEIQNKFILINNGYINDRVDYILIRQYDMNDVESRLNDKRFQKGDFNAQLTLPDNSVISLRNTNTMFVLTDANLDTYPIKLNEMDLSVIHTRKHSSLDQLISLLAQQ